MSGTGKEYGELIKEIREQKEPNRIFFAMNELIRLGYSPTFHAAEKYIEFKFKGCPVRFYPFTGWATGMTIKDGRGLCNLLKQIKKYESKS